MRMPDKILTQILTQNKRTTQGYFLRGSLRGRNLFVIFGGPSGNRTPNLLIKSQVLCLVELTAHEDEYRKNLISILKKVVNFFLGTLENPG